MSNVYYDPQDFDLNVEGSFDWAEPDWSFDMLVVWSDERGQYWVGQDSGCSCPSPFEDVTDVNELDGPYTKAGLKSRLNYLVSKRVEDPMYSDYSAAKLLGSARDILQRIS